VAFLNSYPTRTVLIEGYTDSVGSDDYNQGLSRRRAESVQAYLVGQSIDPARLSASGLGENAPVADNESPTGPADEPSRRGHHQQSGPCVEIVCRVAGTTRYFMPLQAARLTLRGFFWHDVVKTTC
jgi:hypothetical protein